MPDPVSLQRGAPVTTVLLVQDHKVTATVDTGAMLTILDTAEANRMEVRAVSRAELATMDWQGNHTVQVVGVSEQLRFASGTSSTIAKVVIADLGAEQPPILLGTDLLPKLGIVVSDKASTYLT